MRPRPPRHNLVIHGHTIGGKRATVIPRMTFMPPLQLFYIWLVHNFVFVFVIVMILDTYRTLISVRDLLKLNKV